MKLKAYIFIDCYFSDCVATPPQDTPYMAFRHAFTNPGKTCQNLVLMKFKSSGSGIRTQVNTQLFIDDGCLTLTYVKPTIGIFYTKDEIKCETAPYLTESDNKLPYQSR